MKVLVVGGNRFVGAALLPALLAEGDDVSVLALDPPPESVRAHVRWLHADRSDSTRLRELLGSESFDAVVDNIAYEPSHIVTLHDALRGRLGRYVLTGSVDVNGHHLPRMVREEQAPLEPTSLAGTHGNERYLRGKRACEIALRESDVPWVVIRPSMVAGLRDNVGAPPMDALPDPEVRARGRSLFFPARLQNGGPILLRQDDQAVFRLVHVDDVARALALAVRDPRMTGKAFNAAGDEIFTTESLLRAHSVAARRFPDVVHTPAHTLAQAGLASYGPPFGYGTFWSIASNEKLRALGWRPTPAEQWIRPLVDAPVPLHARPGWDLRPREIALARHLLARVTRPPLRPRVEPPAMLPIQGKSLAGRATSIGTKRWSTTRSPAPHEGHWRAFGDLTVGSIGIGTYAGDDSPATDALYRAALRRAILGGLNVVDTAINYRHMRSERVVGEVVRALVAEGVPRDAIVISTKGGFVTHDADDSRPPALCVQDRWIPPGLLSIEDAHRHHCIAPRFIAAQLEESLRNLGLAHVDVYFLHNPELALAALGPAVFWPMLEETFGVLERAARAGRIGRYGLATWEGLRAPIGSSQLIDLGRAFEIARRVGGDSHRFGVIQLPFNIARTEARDVANHVVVGETVSAFEAARRLGLAVYTSASVLQGDTIPSSALPTLPFPATPAAGALQFARSTSGVTTALVGLRRVAHVEEALRVASIAPTLG